MKKIFLSIVVLFVCHLSMAQKPEFIKSMGETLSQLPTCKSVADFQALGNKFEIIANSEKDEWLPLYYLANCYVVMSFIEQNDAAKKDNYLDVAEKSVSKLIVMAPVESDVFVLQALYFIARLVVNPTERGMEFSILSVQAVSKALALDPTNPRAILVKLQSDMGVAAFSGQDPKSFCPQAKELQAKWDNFKPKSPIHPAWGKEQLEAILKGCQ